ncbi:TPA: hypothetical protein ACU9OW_000046 [Legionella pneumophila]
MKKLLIVLSLLSCTFNSHASLFDESLTQTKEEARNSYEIQREIARQNNDNGALQQLNNNYNSQTKDVMEDYRNRALRPYH